ncbi:MAG: hypothetical protein SFX73_12135 [Kofleriaceae bacterium]|nr:hypothetical protein [Kofleriaceae bacterium]
MELRESPAVHAGTRAALVVRMSTKLMLVLSLALGTAACVTDGDDQEPLPTEGDGTEPSLPPTGEFPDDNDTCGSNALKGDGACLPD